MKVKINQTATTSTSRERVIVEQVSMSQVNNVEIADDDNDQHHRRSRTQRNAGRDAAINPAPNRKSSRRQNNNQKFMAKAQAYAKGNYMELRETRRDHREMRAQVMTSLTALGYEANNAREYRAAVDELHDLLMPTPTTVVPQEGQPINNLLLQTPANDNDQVSAAASLPQ